MRQSMKTALGGMVAALSLALMLIVSVIPSMTYALPALAGAFLIVVVLEVDKKWAFGVYCAVAILSMLLVPVKEVALLYTLWFGYYPILKALLEARLPAWLSWTLKIILFDAMMLLSGYLSIRLFGVQIDELDRFGIWAIPILLGIGTVTFILYDYVLTQLISLYLNKWQKHFHRIFHR